MWPVEGSATHESDLDDGVDLDDGDLDYDGEPDPRADAVHHELFFGGPKSSGALIAALTQQGILLSDDDLEDLLDAGAIPHVVELDYAEEPVLVALDGLLEERVFTHRITAAEISASVLTIEPDLKPLMALTDAAPFDQLEDGSPIVEVFSGQAVDPGGSLKFSAGAFSELRPGDLIGFGVGPGGLRIEPVDQLAVPPADLRARVLTSFDDDDSDEGGLPVMLDELIWRVCNDDILAFVEPLAPLTELLASWGLERSGDVVAPAGFDFSTWDTGHRLAEIASSYDLTDEQAAAVLVARHVFLDVLGLVDQEPIASDIAVPEQAGPGGQAATPTEPVLAVSQVPPELADAAVADAVLWETVGAGVKEAVALGALVESWEPDAPRRVRPALAWLRGKSLERLGSVLEAEVAFDESLSLEPSFDNALVDMARYAADRGDAPRAISLLERAGFTDDDPIVAQLRAYLPVDRADVGRNDQCWCGSGRKYKRCHLGRVELGPSEQAAWLYAKAVNFAHNPPHGELLLEVAAVRANALDIDRFEAADDRAVLDVTLFEGGVLAAFLATRGALLPPPEQLVAAAWLPVERSVFEVTDVHRGTAVTLRDLRTGDSHHVPDAELSRSATKGEVVSVRLLPVGETVEIHSGVEPVAPDLLDETLQLLHTADDAAADPFGLISILSARYGRLGVSSKDRG